MVDVSSPGVPARTTRSCVRVGRWLVAVVVLLAPVVASAQPRPPQAPWRTKLPGAPGSREGAGLLLRVDHLRLPSVDAWQMRGDVGLVLRPLDRLAFDVGIGMGGGRMLRLDGPDTFVDLGASLDTRVFLTPYSAVQLYLLGGVALGAMNASLRSRALAPGEECPGDALFYLDLSAGVGAEVALSPSVSLLASGRVVRRGRLGGDLVFATEGVNPAREASDAAVGFSVGLSFVAYLRP